LRAKLAEKLSKENEERLKIVQLLELEKGELEKQASELAEENEKLRAEAEQLKTKPSLLNCLLGRKGGQEHRLIVRPSARASRCRTAKHGTNSTALS
jgi:hypothetical protein